jgi:hypothetical protein
MKKWSENGVCGEFRVCGKKWGKEGNGWPVVGGDGGEVPRWCVGGVGNDGVVWMWCSEVFRGRETEMEGEKGCTAG